MQTGTLHLIPTQLAEHAFHVLPAYLRELVTGIRIFYVEDLRSARRFLKAMNKDIVIDDLTFHLLNEHEQDALRHAAPLFKAGKTIAMLSEAGCPGVADPGKELVRIAHQSNAIVKPHTGPNSILLTLMASGFNGQHFEFHGYLPNKQPLLGQKIQELERESRVKNVSQFFIETPYRNDQLLKEILLTCKGDTMLCIGVNLTGENEKIVSRSITEWKSQQLSFHKQPAVFGLYVEA